MHSPDSMLACFTQSANRPARRIGWMSRHGERLELPAQGDGEAACPATGERYRLAGDTLAPL